MKEIAWALGYFVTEAGDVFSTKKNRMAAPRLLRPGRHTIGYCQYGLVVNGKIISARGHRLVAEAFLPNPDNLPVVRHLDGDPRNNAVGNLAWSSQRENIHDKWRHGTMAAGARNGRSTHPQSTPRGEACSFAKLTVAQVIEIRARRANGEMGRALAKEFGVAPSTICAVYRGHNWGSLP